MYNNFNPLNAELNPTCYLLALLGTHHILHISRIRVNSLRLIDYLYNHSISDIGMFGYIEVI